MKCTLCNLTMDMLGSKLTADGKDVLSNWRCHSCGKRVLQREASPLYNAAPKTAVPVVPRRYGSGKRGEVDLGYVERPCCARCGEVLRESTSDGLCNLCAEAAA